MNWYSIFYWLTVADSVKNFFDVVSNIFTFFTVVFFIIMIITNVGKAITTSENEIKSDQEEKTSSNIRAWELAKGYSTRLFYPFLIIALFTWVGYVATPSKKDCMLIVAGGAVGNFISSDSTAHKIPSDITKFLHMGIQEQISKMGEEARRDLNLQTPKEKFLDKVKDMTKDEIINYLQSDSTIVKK